MTVPNIVAGLRLLASPALIGVALAGRSSGVLLLFLALEVSDWVDGKLAVLLDQRTELGARLDSVADATMYGSLLVALAILEGQTFLGEWPWIAPAIVAFATSWVLSLVKFGRLPGYHTWAAKSSWYFVVIAVVALLVLGDLRPVRIAAVVVTLANIEAILITRRLDSPRADVRSIIKA